MKVACRAVARSVGIFIPAVEPAFALASLRAKDGSGSGSHTHLNEFMRLISVRWSSFPQLNWLARSRPGALRSERSLVENGG